jgi:hypothetical protein
MSNSNIIHLIYFLIILYLIYLLYQDYIYDKNNKDNFILCTDDFEKNIHIYSKSELYNKINNLSAIDKQFLDNYIIYTITKHKSEKPSINKKIKSVKYDILAPSLIASCINFSLTPGINVFRNGILQQFAMNII